MKAPDVIGEVIAWRAWQVVGTKTRPMLVSVTRHVVWPASQWLEAECSSKHHEDAPHTSCSCGIYAAHTRAQVVSQGYEQYDASGPRVLGEVALAGTIIPAERGFRAERARPYRLLVPYEFWRLAAPLGRVYGVPIELANIFREEA